MVSHSENEKKKIVAFCALQVKLLRFQILQPMLEDAVMLFQFCIIWINL